ncbi:recombinase RecA, partial [Klebsiella pneumoniae]|nr:recombinase RecA [Klebsiella pneumoniae]
MAKNYQQQGMTIAIVNSGTKPVTSGSLVQVGSLAAVAITD